MALILEIKNNDPSDICQENSWLFNSESNAVQEKKENLPDNLHQVIKADKLRIDCKNGRYYLLQDQEKSFLKEGDVLLVQNYRIKISYDSCFPQENSQSSGFYRSCDNLFSDDFFASETTDVSLFDGRDRLPKNTDSSLSTSFVNDAASNRQKSMFVNKEFIGSSGSHSESNEVSSYEEIDPLGFLYDPHHFDLIRQKNEIGEVGKMSEINVADRKVYCDNKAGLFRESGSEEERATDFSDPLISFQSGNFNILRANGLLSSRDAIRGSKNIEKDMEKGIEQEGISNSGNILRDLGFLGY